MNICNEASKKYNPLLLKTHIFLSLSSRIFNIFDEASSPLLLSSLVFVFKSMLCKEPCPERNQKILSDAIHQTFLLNFILCVLIRTSETTFSDFSVKKLNLSISPDSCLNHIESPLPFSAKFIILELRVWLPGKPLWYILNLLPSYLANPFKVLIHIKPSLPSTIPDIND